MKIKPSVVGSEYEDIEEIETNIPKEKVPKLGDGQLYEQALGLVIRNSEISINQLRKKYNVGFSRAKRIIEQLEKNNIIESYSGGGSTRIIKLPKDRVVQSGKVENKTAFKYVNHVLKMPNDISIVEDDVL